METSAADVEQSNSGDGVVELSPEARKWQEEYERLAAGPMEKKIKLLRNTVAREKFNCFASALSNINPKTKQCLLYHFYVGSSPKWDKITNLDLPGDPIQEYADLCLKLIHE